MKFSAVFVAAMAGVAAAIPESSESRLARRQADRIARRNAYINSNFNMKGEEVHDNNDKQVQYSSNWAGAVQIGEGFTSVTGTITVPEVTGQDPEAAASAWVGIDGDTCQAAILQTGVSFYGDGTFDVWYEWIPDYSHSFTGISIAAGDQVRMTVDASSTTSGTATVENLTNGDKVSHKFSNPPSTLCQTNAEWIVEDFSSGGNLVPFADFGSVTFTDASASGSSGTISPAGATIFDIKSARGQVLTSCGTSGGEVTCDYAG